MRCKTCDYPLWGISARTCPECGSAFKPSDFDLVPNSVRFLCPHCDQQYYGTGVRGHLDPIEFDCVSCGTHIHMDEMDLVQREGVDEHRTRTTSNPWLERPRRKLRSAYYRTVGMSLASPIRLARATPRESPVGSAFSFFAVHLCWIGALLTLPMLVLMVGMFTPGHRGMLSVFLPFVMMFVVPLVTLTAVMIVWGFLTHLILIFVAGRPTVFGDTYKALGYGSAPVLLMAVPCVGFYAAPVAAIWWTVSTIAILTTIHRIAWWRAAIAHLLGMVIAMGIPIGGIAFLTIRTVANSTAAIHMSMATLAGSNLASALSVNPLTTTGATPVHFIDTITTSQNFGYAVDTIGIATIAPHEIRIDGHSLFDHMVLPSNQRDPKDADLRAAMLPSGVHRIGHIVFTYHGVDLVNPPTTDLWIAVVWPDPDDPSAVFQKPERVLAFDIAGTAHEFDRSRFSVNLNIQNSMRKSQGIPEIPDPATVRMWPPGSPYGPSPPPTPVP